MADLTVTGKQASEEASAVLGRRGPLAHAPACLPRWPAFHPAPLVEGRPAPRWPKESGLTPHAGVP